MVDPFMKIFTVVVLAVISNCGFAQMYDTNNVIVETFAGSGFVGYYDGQGTQSMFERPSAIVADSAGNLFVVDEALNTLKEGRIRKITQDAIVSTIAGGGYFRIPCISYS